MQIISSLVELRARLRGERAIAFVPTMGNLHEGHLALMRQARQHGSCVVASIFVNPLQFGPTEDFDRYPRTFVADCAKLRGLVDVLFAPAVEDMYPHAQQMFVELPVIANELCGATRPGHFRGMATVVLKLLNMVQPQVALFGKKDYQQLHIIRQMVAQFNLPIRIEGGETVRAQDGLALSSRNQYLSDDERMAAAGLYRVLQEAQARIVAGERGFTQLEQAAADALSREGWQVDYVAVRNRNTLLQAAGSDSDWVILAAAKLGQTRLLDNVEVCLVG